MDSSSTCKQPVIENDAGEAIYSIYGWVDPETGDLAVESLDHADPFVIMKNSIASFDQIMSAEMIYDTPLIFKYLM